MPSENITISANAVLRQNRKPRVELHVTAESEGETIRNMMIALPLDSARSFRNDLEAAIKFIEEHERPFKEYVAQGTKQGVRGQYKKRRKMSKEARKRISEAAKARWERRKGKVTPIKKSA